MNCISPYLRSHQLLQGIQFARLYLYSYSILPFRLVRHLNKSQVLPIAPPFCRSPFALWPFCDILSCLCALWQVHMMVRLAKRIYDLVLNKLKTFYFATCFGQQQPQEQYRDGYPQSLSWLHSGVFRFVRCSAVEQIN